MLKARAWFITRVTTEGALLLALKIKLYYVPLDMAQLRPPSTSAYRRLSAAIRVVLTFERNSTSTWQKDAGWSALCCPGVLPCLLISSIKRQVQGGVEGGREATIAAALFRRQQALRDWRGV